MRGLYGKPTSDYAMTRPFGLLLMRGFVGSVYSASIMAWMKKKSTTVHFIYLMLDPSMANGHGIETPANKIATAQAVLSLAFRLNSEVTAGRINTEIFNHEVTVITGGTGVTLPAFPEGTDEDLKLGSFNLVFIALSASALTTDETLDQVFGKLSAETDNNRRSIRVMVNQLRNAFAHNPWRPRWLIFPQYRYNYSITLDDGSMFTFDATSLNGDGVKPEQVGGLEFWIKLLQHCERLVSAKV